MVHGFAVASSSGIIIPIGITRFIFDHLDVQEHGEKLHAESASNRMESRKRQAEQKIVAPKYKD